MKFYREHAKEKSLVVCRDCCKCIPKELLPLEECPACHNRARRIPKFLEDQMKVNKIEDGMGRVIKDE